MLVLSLTGPQRTSGCGLTSVQALVAALHDSAVNAGDEPRPRHHTEQQPHHTATDAHHHVVEEEEVGEAVKGLPVEGEAERRPAAGSGGEDSAASIFLSL